MIIIVKDRTAKQQLLGELKMNLLKSRHVLGIGQRNIQGIAEKLGLSVSPIENKVLACIFHPKV